MVIDRPQKHRVDIVRTNYYIVLNRPENAITGAGIVGKSKKKETKMNIRIDADELEAIKKRAAEEGLKYQPFVRSVLHKYITGRLVEKGA